MSEATSSHSYPSKNIEIKYVQASTVDTWVIRRKLNIFFRYPVNWGKETPVVHFLTLDFHLEVLPVPVVIIFLEREIKMYLLNVSSELHIGRYRLCISLIMCPVVSFPRNWLNCCFCRVEPQIFSSLMGSRQGRIRPTGLKYSWKML